MARFAVYVVPGSRRRGPDGFYGELPRLRVVAPALEGRANREAQQTLSDLLAARARLVSGARSRKKTFDVDMRKEVLASKLRDVFGN